MSKANVRAALVKEFDAKHVDACLNYYAAAGEKFVIREWDGVALKVGKFIEAVTKALMVRGSKPLPPGKDFKAGAQLRQMEQLTALPSDVLRLVIPKALIFINEIVNNRLGRHDKTTDIDPHEMDAVVVMPTMSWVLAELVRYCSAGADPDEATAMIQELSVKVVPFAENIDGRTYVNGSDLKPADITLLLLYDAYPNRIARDELVKAVKRHGIAQSSVYAAVSKVKALVDDDNGEWKLRTTGKQRAEKILGTLAVNLNNS